MPELYGLRKANPEALGCLHSGPITLIFSVGVCGFNQGDDYVVGKSIRVLRRKLNVAIEPFPRVLNPDVSAHPAGHRLQNVPA
jgi:hypothetical protein